MARKRTHGRYTLTEVDPTSVIDKMRENDEEIPPVIRTYRLNNCFVIVAYSKDLGWHMSISHDDRLPNWDEIKTARYEFLPKDIIMAVLLPKEVDVFNENENYFHLWQINKGD